MASESMNPSIAIIIPAFNAAASLECLLRTCLEQDYPTKLLDIILVDDGSTDDTLAKAKGFPIRWISQPNQGPAAARNAGWRSSKAALCCFLDSDCLPEKNWVRLLTSLYQENNIAGVGGSYDIINNKSLLARCIHEEIVQRHSKMKLSVNYLGSFNVSYRRSVLEEVGGFDESFRMASAEDNELAYRIKKKGYRLVFDPTIKVGHHHPTRLSNYLRSQFWHGFWRVRLYQLHPDMAKGDQYAGWLDFAQPPLSLLSLAGLLLLFIPAARMGWSVLTLLLVLMQLPTALSVVARTRNMQYLALIPVTFLRAYARGLGLLWGVLRWMRLPGTKR